MFGDQLCKSCHTTLKYRAAHRIHTFGSCIQCHMPWSASIGEAGDARSHTFRFMSPGDSIKAGGVDAQMNACSNCHQHKKTPLVNLALFLEGAKKTDMPKTFNVHRKPKEADGDE